MVDQKFYIRPLLTSFYPNPLNTQTLYLSPNRLTKVGISKDFNVHYGILIYRPGLMPTKFCIFPIYLSIQKTNNDAFNNSFVFYRHHRNRKKKSMFTQIGSNAHIYSIKWKKRFLKTDFDGPMTYLNKYNNAHSLVDYKRHVK